MQSERFRSCESSKCRDANAARTSTADALDQPARRDSSVHLERLGGDEDVSAMLPPDRDGPVYRMLALADGTLRFAAISVGGSVISAFSEPEPADD